MRRERHTSILMMGWLFLVTMTELSLAGCTSSSPDESTQQTEEDVRSWRKRHIGGVGIDAGSAPDAASTPDATTPDATAQTDASSPASRRQHPRRCRHAASRREQQRPARQWGDRGS
jgi:hypothetical protein